MSFEKLSPVLPKPGEAETEAVHAMVPSSPAFGKEGELVRTHA
jgi:hypothetical protein